MLSCVRLYRHHGLYVALQALLSMGVLQARKLEWVAMPSFRESSQPRDRTHVSHFAGGYFFYHLSHQGSLFFPVVIYRCEGWTIKKIESWRYFWAVVLEKTLENPFDCKEIKSVSPKGNQPWTFIGRTDAEAEVVIFWPPDVKSRLIRKDPDTGKDWGQEEKGATEGEMVLLTQWTWVWANSRS